ncbi:MAG: DNA-processing protein DprA [Bacillota bacterium]
MRYTPKQKLYVWLNAIVGLTSRRIYQLNNIMNLDDLVETKAYMGAECRNIITSEQEEKLKVGMHTTETDELFSRMEELDIGVVLEDDNIYPASLRTIKNNPQIIYFRGDFSLIKETKMLSVVGSRALSSYGKSITAKFCNQLSVAGLTIVSGMADGVDGVAHKAALDAGGKTIAVLGCGIDVVYPLKHAWMYNEIVKNGLIISEHCLGVRPNNYHFPNRNRIISALSDAVLVTEAGKKSGALITANYAIEQGKNLFIVPTNADNPMGEGSNQMLKRLQGSMVLSASDILEEMGVSEYRETASLMQLDFSEVKILDTILFGVKVHYDELFAVMDLKVGDLSGLLTSMEVRGLIAKTDINHYGV